MTSATIVRLPDRREPCTGGVWVASTTVGGAADAIARRRAHEAIAHFVAWTHDASALTHCRGSVGAHFVDPRAARRYAVALQRACAAYARRCGSRPWLRVGVLGGLGDDDAIDAAAELAAVAGAGEILAAVGAGADTPAAGELVGLPGAACPARAVSVPWSSLPGDDLDPAVLRGCSALHMP